MSPEAVLPNHAHLSDRLIKVLGAVYYGTKKFDFKTAESYSAGAIIYTPAQTHHLYAKDQETVLQQTGVGSTEIDFLK